MLKALTTLVPSCIERSRLRVVKDLAASLRIHELRWFRCSQLLHVALLNPPLRETTAGHLPSLDPWGGEGGASGTWPVHLVPTPRSWPCSVPVGRRGDRTWPGAFAA